MYIFEQLIAEIKNISKLLFYKFVNYNYFKIISL